MNETPALPASVLDAVCHSATRLVSAAQRPLRRLRVQSGDAVVEVEWPEPKDEPQDRAAEPDPGPADRPPPGVDGESAPDLHYIRAPMVGTFYHAPEPGARPFVSVGDVVERGQPVGIVEVMKFMNVVEADTPGRVVEILVPNAEPVEFEQCLIALAPVTAT